MSTRITRFQILVALVAASASQSLSGATQDYYVRDRISEARDRIGMQQHQPPQAHIPAPNIAELPPPPQPELEAVAEEAPTTVQVLVPGTMPANGAGSEDDCRSLLVSTHERSANTGGDTVIEPAGSEFLLEQELEQSASPAPAPTETQEKSDVGIDAGPQTEGPIDGGAGWFDLPGRKSGIAHGMVPVGNHVWSNSHYFDGPTGPGAAAPFGFTSIWQKSGHGAATDALGNRRDCDEWNCLCGCDGCDEPFGLDIFKPPYSPPAAHGCRHGLHSRGQSANCEPACGTSRSCQTSGPVAVPSLITIIR